MSIITAAITLFLVMDPLGNLPVFITILSRLPEEERKWVVLRESLIALIVLMLFLFGGSAFLEHLSLTDDALSIAGGIILFLIAIKMIFPDGDESISRCDQDPFIVPLAVPLIAGPSSMAMVMLLAHQHPTKSLECFSALLIAWVIATIILYCGQRVSKLLGKRCLNAIERLMGMLLTILAVQMLLNGFTHYFNVCIVSTT